MNTPEDVNDDFKDFIALLNKHNVDYCITGAYAVSFYSEPRSTSDLDVYIAHTADNSARVAAAVKEFIGTDIDKEYFNTESTVILRMGLEPNQIELANGLTGLSDDEVMGHRIKASYKGIETYFIGIEDLVKNKGIVKNLARRGRKQGTDTSDYEILSAKIKYMREGSL